MKRGALDLVGNRRAELLRLSTAVRPGEASRHENAFLAPFPYVAAPNQGDAPTGHR